MLSKLLRGLAIVALALGFAGAGAFLSYRMLKGPRVEPDPAAVAVQIREVARLETLELQLYKKVSFNDEPEAGASFTQDVLNWAKFTLRPSRGKAIVFATARVGLDLERLDRKHLRIHGGDVWVVLPPLSTTVELRPGETEVIGSNLDSQQTAELLQMAKDAFEREVSHDPKLREKAKASAERSIRGLLLSVGFDRVHFVDGLPGGTGEG
jgi:hypothetical protein